MPGEKLDMTKEELERLSEALKKEEFRKLLMDYAEELADPATREIYENELTMLESQRGVDMKFIKPEPGFVLKTQDDKGGKVFVNVCTSPHVGVPEFTYAEKTSEGGKVDKGQQCSLPYSLSPVHAEKDNKDVECQVYDVVFHPDTLSRCSNPQFKELVVNTSLEGVCTNFKLKLQTQNVKFPKIKFKGTPQECVIRKRVEEEKDGAFDHLPSRPEFPEMPGEDKKEDKPSEKKDKKKEDSKTKPADEPEYKMVFRDQVDMANFTNDRVSNGVVPSQTIVKISLPLHANARDVDLDVYSDSLELHSQNYNLTLKLPYQVDSDNGTAKFDKDTRELVVTLDVMPQAQEIKQEEVPESLSTGLIEEIPEEYADELTDTTPSTSTSESAPTKESETQSTADTPEAVISPKSSDDIIADSIAECMADVSDATSSDLSEPSIIDIPTTDIPTTDIPNSAIPNSDIPNNEIPNSDIPNSESPTSESTNFDENFSVPDYTDSIESSSDSIESGSDSIVDQASELNANSQPSDEINVSEINSTVTVTNLEDETSTEECVPAETLPTFTSSVKPSSLEPVNIIKPSDITVKLNNGLQAACGKPSPRTSRGRFNISPVPCSEDMCHSADPISCAGHPSCGKPEPSKNVQAVSTKLDSNSEEHSSVSSGLSGYTDCSLEDNLNVSVRVYQDMSTATVILDTIYNSVPEVTIVGKKVWLKNEDMSLYLILPHAITTHTISMNLANVCLVLYKQHKSHWPTIHIGNYEEEVYSFKFITEENCDYLVESFGDPWVNVEPFGVSPHIKTCDSETTISYTLTNAPNSIPIFPNTHDDDDDDAIKGILKSPHSPPLQSPRSRKVSFNEEVETFVLPSKRSIKGKKRRKKSNSGSSASDSSDEGATPPPPTSPLQKKAVMEAAGDGTDVTEGLILESAENGWSTVSHKKKSKGKKAASSPPPDSSDVFQTQQEAVKVLDPSGKSSHQMLLGNTHIYDLED